MNWSAAKKTKTWWTVNLKIFSSIFIAIKLVTNVQSYFMEKVKSDTCSYLISWFVANIRCMICPTEI